MSFVDDVMKEFEEEDKQNLEQPTQTQTEPEPAPEPEPEPEPAKEEPEKDDDKPFAHEPPKEWARPKDETEPEQDQPKPEHKAIPDDKFSRAEFSFRRQLGKQKEKYEAELKSRDEKYDALQKELAELKKQMNPQKPLTRDQFADDEDFMHALNKADIEKAFAERDAAEEAKRKEREEAEARRKAEEADIAERQRAWLDNVDRAFGGDKARSDKFVHDIQRANEKGLGTILDACPPAADYLINNPSGPIVYEHLLNDRGAFERVFNERRLSPLDVYYELRTIEQELRSRPATEAPKPAPVPRMGKPGKQAGSGSAPDIWSDDDAMREYIRSHH